MSELPWDKKKNKNDNDDDNQINGDESPSEPPSFDEVPDLSTLASENTKNNSSSGSTDENSSSKKAPDVLLNAFDDEPMEEVDELEPVDSDEKSDTIPDKTESLSFDDVPDLSNLISENIGNGKDNASDNSNVNKNSSFKQPPDILQNAFNNDPMEKVEVLEHIGSDESEYSAESKSNKSPPFDGVPDLTNLVSGSTENKVNAVSGVDESSDEVSSNDNEPLDEQQPIPSFGNNSTHTGENKTPPDTDINESDTRKPSELESEIEPRSLTEDEQSAESGNRLTEPLDVSNNQTHESNSFSESDNVNKGKIESDDFSSSFKNKFKSISQRRNLFDQLDEAQSEGQPVAKPVNESSDKGKSLDTFRNKIQNISHERNLTDGVEQLRKKVDMFQTKNTAKNAEDSADDRDIEPSQSSQESEHPAPSKPENHVSFDDLSDKPENEDSPEEPKFETTSGQSDQQTPFWSVKESTKNEPDNHKNSAYIEKFNDLTASFKNKFKNIKQKTSDLNEQTRYLDKTSPDTDNLTPPPLFEPRIPEEMEDTGEKLESTDELTSDKELDKPDKKPGFLSITKLKLGFEKILNPFKILFKGSSNRRSLKNQMEQMKEEIDEEEKEESAPEFVPPFEQENDEEGEKTSKIGKISGFFKGITQRGGLKKRMKRFRGGDTGSEENFEFDPSTVGIESQQITGQPEGLSFEQVDKLVNKKLYEHQKQFKDVVDKKIDKVFSKEYMDYIASRVSTNQAGNLQELQSKVNGSTNRVEKVTNDLQNLTNNVDELEDRLKEIQRRNEDFESKIDNTYYSTSDRIDNIEYQLKNLQDTLGISPDSNEKVSSIETRIDEIEGALDSAQSENQDVKAELSNIQQSISDMYNSYKDLLSHLNEVNESYESKFSDLYDKVSKVDSVESKISEIDKNIRNRDESLSKLEDEISVIKNAIKRNHKENQSLANSIEDLKQLSAITRTENKENKSEVTGKNVQLEHIPKNSVSMRICMEWLKYLMNHVGGNNLDEVLAYYRDLGWINDNVRLELLKYSEGINQTNEKSDWKLTKTDHIKSIWFIQKLAGSNFDFDSLQNIEKDVNQIKEST